VQAFIKEFNARNARSIVGVDADVLAAFEEYSWPGNVRELRNVIERATIVAEAPLISMRDLPTLIDHQRVPQARSSLAPGMTVDEAERVLILMTLEHTKGNKTHAAELLDISLKTLHNKLDRYEHQEQRGPSQT
jgi:DNA-binding NtrC family response regulator